MKLIPAVLLAGSALLAASAQAAPTFNYTNLQIVEGVGLADATSGAKYITIGMTKAKAMANAPQMQCDYVNYCVVKTSETTGWVTVHLDGNAKVIQLDFYQDPVAHKWPTKKGAVDGMTLAQVHALYKGSTLSSTTDPTQTPADGYVRTKNSNYLYETYTFCDDTGCVFQTTSTVRKGTKP